MPGDFQVICGSMVGENRFRQPQLKPLVFSFFRTVTFSQDLFFKNSFFFGAKIL